MQDVRRRDARRMQDVRRRDARRMQTLFFSQTRFLIGYFLAVVYVFIFRKIFSNIFLRVFRFRYLFFFVNFVKYLILFYTPCDV